MNASTASATPANRSMSLPSGSNRPTRTDEAADAGAMKAADRLHRAVTDAIVTQIEADRRALVTAAAHASRAADHLAWLQPQSKVSIIIPVSHSNTDQGATP